MIFTTRDGFGCVLFLFLCLGASRRHSFLFIVSLFNIIGRQSFAIFQFFFLVLDYHGYRNMEQRTQRLRQRSLQ